MTMAMFFWLDSSSCLVRAQAEIVGQLARISSALAFSSVDSSASRRRPLPRSRAFSTLLVDGLDESLVVVVDLRLLDGEPVGRR